MKQFLFKVTLSRLFGSDRSYCFPNRRETLGSEATVRFLLHFCRRYTILRKASHTFSAIKNIESSRHFLQKNLVRNLKILIEIFYNKTIRQDLVRFLHE